MDKKIIFSGIQPSGVLTLGNYLGALRNWVQLQDEYLSYYCVVDMHAITVRQTPADLRRNCVSLLALYLASGIDPEKNILFYQSQVSAHAELAWVLNCYAYMGELSRMTQYKEKSARHAENINAGLFTYPALMAADILLYQADLVPVGNDQKQHLELARDLALRFNNAYGETFRVPEIFLSKTGARIMSLTEPTQKMSKSDENENGYISLLDAPDAIMKKVKRAVTDSDGVVAFNPEEKPGVSNLLQIFATCRGISTEEAATHFAGAGYGRLKEETGEACVALLAPLQARYAEIMKDKPFLERLAREGAEKAREAANKTLWKVQKKVGFAPRKL